jgi:threonine synthase
MGHLYCRACATTYALNEPIWRCACGGLLDIAWKATIDPARIATRAPSLWRYREALPIADDAAIVSLGEGFTPLIEERLDGRPVWLKLDHLFPSGSYKDRGATVLVSQVKALGLRHVVEDSSGNAGSAIAGYCARAGIACDIYVPADTSAGKLAQIEGYGARLHRVPGSREDAARAVWQAAQSCYYASHTWNPFFLQGTKTWAYEVCEQLGWRAPEAVVLPVGNGTLLLGAYLGFRDLIEAGMTDTMPRLVGVQAAACAPLATAYANGVTVPAAVATSPTLAEGIAIAEPVRGSQILEAVRASGGTILAVSEVEIVSALRHMHRRGFYIEPTAAATIAGLRRYLAESAGDGVIVSTLTGHGLKATDKLLHL